MTSLKLKYATLLVLILFQCYCFSQTTSIKIMSYNTRDASSNWNDRKPHLQNVIHDIDPDIIVAIEINNNNTDDFLNNVLGGA